LAGADDDGSRLYDSGFFRRDEFDGMAQIIFMIEIYGGDDGDFGRNDIRSVETAAQANFINGKLHGVRSERDEGHGGYAFEECRMSRKFSGGHERFDCGMNF